MFLQEKEKAHMERVRLKIIADRERVFRKTAEKVNKRWPYEDAIKRPYFHLKPLEKAQLKNWKEYLDFEMGEGNHKRICFLFERCVVACALYEDMWEKVNVFFGFRFSQGLCFYARYLLAPV